MKLTRQVFLIFFLILSSVLAGCAGAPEKPPERVQGVFFPDPPELPRVQYLRSYTSSQDIETPGSKFEKFVTGEQEIIKRLDKPYGVAIHEGKIYVCDTNFSVMVFDLKAKTFHTIEGAKGLGKPIQPINITIDSEGTKYVADPVRGQVLTYDRKDFFVKAFGSPLEWTPIDVAVFEDRLYVVDKRNNDIWVLDKKTGAQRDKIGKKSENKLEWVVRPTNLAFDALGNLFVSDVGRFQVVKLDRDGHFLGTIGVLGTSPGRFSRPRGLTTDRAGNVYVTDAAFDNVQIFTPEGRLLMFFGKPGNTPGDLFLPAQIAIDYTHLDYFSDYIDPNFDAEALVIVTNQFGPRLVNIFALGKQKGVKYPTDVELRQQLDEMKKKIEEKEKRREEEKKKSEAEGKTEEK